MLLIYVAATWILRAICVGISLILNANLIYINCKHGTNMNLILNANKIYIN